MNQTRPRRPATRADFEVAVICALPIEADAVDALLDHHWDDEGPPYDKAAGDPNAYSTGAIGRHNVVLAHMPGMGKSNATAVAANCRASFPNIKLAVVVGICGVVPFGPNGDKIILGDVIISDGVVQCDFGRRLPGRFARKDTLLDALGRPNAEVRVLLAKLKSLRGRKMLRDSMSEYMEVLRVEPELAASYPGIAQDILFEATYRHLVPRRRLGQGSPQPVVHFGLIASGDTVMKSSKDRDSIARQESLIAFEMEGAGVWDSFPCVVIKGACDYADSHKTKAWQRYAAATAAACIKAFLGHWVPSLQPVFVPYPRNRSFSTSQERIALCDLGGIGKTQIALEYAYCLTNPEISVFWVHASTAERFRQAYASIAQECQVPGYDDPKTDVLPLMKKWLERKDFGRWLMVIDNADDVQVFFTQQKRLADGSSSGHEGNLGRYIPECSHGTILITTRNRQTGSKLTKGKRLIEVGEIDEEETAELLRTRLDGINTTSGESSALSSRLKHLPLALVQASAFMQENCLTIDDYLKLLDKSDQHFVDLLSEEFETEGRDSETPRAVAETWILSFEQIQRQNAFAGELLSLMSLFDRQAIPLDFLSHYSEQLGEEEIGDIELTKALGVLKSFCFITGGKGYGFDMHRLVQLVTKRWLIKNGTIRRFARQAFLVVSDVYPYSNHKNRAICSAYLPHANAVLKLDITRTDEEMWKDAEDVWSQAVDIRRAVLGEEHPTTLRGMDKLATAYWNQG
ncbi:nucleoside phosphorylase domain-containing protein [Corynascus similis CBS 632.67]